MTHVNAARHYAQLFMDAEVMGYSQWFARKRSKVVDALSQDWHSNDNKLTSILCFHFPKQMPEHFEIAPLPNKISSWLTSLLQRLPVSEQLWEIHMMTQVEPGGDGKNTASLLDAVTFTWTDSENKRKFSCPDDSWGSSIEHWLREQSEVPFHMWYRPFGQRAARTQQRIQTTNIASFCQENFEHFKMKIPSKPSKKPYRFQSSFN
jgi:hypothetical protein